MAARDLIHGKRSQQTDNQAEHCLVHRNDRLLEDNLYLYLDHVDQGAGYAGFVAHVPRHGPRWHGADKSGRLAKFNE